MSLEVLVIYLSLYSVKGIPPAYFLTFFLVLPTSSVSSPSLTAPHPPHPLSTVRHAEFSPFGWRLGFIWKAEGKPFGRRALRREGKLRCGRLWGGAREDREPGIGACFLVPFVSAGWTPWRCSLLFGCSYCANF